MKVLNNIPRASESQQREIQQSADDDRGNYCTESHKYFQYLPLSFVSDFIFLSTSVYVAGTLVAYEVETCSCKSVGI